MTSNVPSPKDIITFSSFADLLEQLRARQQLSKSIQLEQRQQEQRREHVAQMIPRFRFRLAQNCAADFDAVRELESKNVLDPVTVQRELPAFKNALALADGDYDKLDVQQFPFLLGEHVSLVPEDLLREVWQNGYIWMAEYEHNGKHSLAGYSYGLSRIPHRRIDGSHNFPNLDAGDIVGSGQQIVLDHQKECVAGWRTTVDKTTPDGENLRRLGLGSVLKLLSLLSHLRSRTHFTLNVGTLSGMPNRASTLYNTNFLDLYGVRRYTTPILVSEDPPTGMTAPLVSMLHCCQRQLYSWLHKAGMKESPYLEEHVGDMHWTALGNSINAAIAKLTAHGGPIDRTGWTPALDMIKETGMAGEIELCARRAAA